MRSAYRILLLLTTIRKESFVDMNVDTPIINWERISRNVPPGGKAINVFDSPIF